MRLPVPVACLFAIFCACIAGGFGSFVYVELFDNRHRDLGPVLAILTAVLSSVVLAPFELMFGIVPALLGMGAIGLPVHQYLVRTGRTEVYDYFAAGLLVGGAFVALFAMIGGSYAHFGVPCLTGSVGGAVAFRSARGNLFKPTL